MSPRPRSWSEIPSPCSHSWLESHRSEPVLDKRSDLSQVLDIPGIPIRQARDMSAPHTAGGLLWGLLDPDPDHEREETRLQLRWHIAGVRIRDGYQPPSRQRLSERLSSQG